MTSTVQSMSMSQCQSTILPEPDHDHSDDYDDDIQPYWWDDCIQKFPYNYYTLLSPADHDELFGDDDYEEQLYDDDEQLYDDEEQLCDGEQLYDDGEPFNTTELWLFDTTELQLFDTTELFNTKELHSAMEHEPAMEHERVTKLEHATGHVHALEHATDRAHWTNTNMDDARRNPYCANYFTMIQKPKCRLLQYRPPPLGNDKTRIKKPLPSYHDDTLPKFMFDGSLMAPTLRESQPHLKEKETREKKVTPNSSCEPSRRWRGWRKQG